MSHCEDPQNSVVRKVAVHMVRQRIETRERNLTVGGITLDEHGKKKKITLDRIPSPCAFGGTNLDKLLTKRRPLPKFTTKSKLLKREKGFDSEKAFRTLLNEDKKVEYSSASGYSKEANFRSKDLLHLNQPMTENYL